MDNRVGIVVDKRLKYPNYPYGDRMLSRKLGDLMVQIGLMKDNPFDSLVGAGGIVVIKPNWVIDFNKVEDSIESLVTHTSIIRFAIDSSIKALGGSGRIIIADAPVQGCNFDNLLKQTRVLGMLEDYKNRYRSINFEIIDLRKTVLDRYDQKGGDGDPQGYSLIDVGDQSLLTDLNDKYERFRVTMYDYKLMREHHNLVKNEYLISNTLLNADLVVNLPKMKCHIKAGLTGALKNLVGINGHKEFLPHHIAGSYFEGGDQYIYKNRLRDLYNWLYDKYWSSQKKSVLSRKVVDFLGELSKIGAGDDLLDGGWYGNQTIPRTTIDLNNIFYFYDLKRKKLMDRPVRKVINVVDGIVAGEGNGPLSPTSKPLGVLLAGFNPLAVDICMGQLMGYSVKQINTLYLGWRHRLSRFGEGVDVEKIVAGLPNLDFKKPEYWKLLSRE